MLLDADLIRFILKFQAFNTITLTDVATEEVSLLLMFSDMLMFLPVDLLGLLNWRSNPAALDQILQRLMEVEGGEIVKVSCLLVTNAASKYLIF